MIASFDIGEVNFAYCIGTPESITVLKHINIKKKTKQTVTESCDILSEILSKENFNNCEKVIIEQQVLANSRAQRLAQHVWTWFKILYPNLCPEFISASVKTKRNLNYRQRKKEAVSFLIKELTDKKDFKNLEYLSTIPKLDDVADAYTQLVSFSKRI